MTARPQDVALLPDLDEWLRGCPDPSKVSPEWLVKKPSRLLWRCRDALASAQVREEALRAEVERWRGHYDDMSRRAVEAVDRREDAEARAGRLEEALRELFDDYKRLADSGDAGFWKLEDTYAGKKALAALSTNVATQTGETT